MPLPALAVIAKQIVISTILTMGAAQLGKALQKKITDKSHYSWDEPDTQEDVPYPWVFGRMKVEGTPFTQYRSITHSEYHTLPVWWSFFHHEVDPPDVEGTDDWNVDKAVKSCRETLNVRIGVSEGPIQGFVADKGFLDDKALTEISGITYTDRIGTDSQTATGLGDSIEYPQNTPVILGTPVTISMPTKDYYRCGLTIGFLNGLCAFDDGGGKDTAYAKVKIEIREIGGAWHTLFDYYVFGFTINPLYYTFVNDGQYSNGTPFTVTAGVQHEWRVTYVKKQSHADRTAMTVSNVQAIYDENYTFPGLAYREIQAIASEALSGTLKYRDVIDGLVLEDLERTVIEHSRNPARVAMFLITRPVFKGTGDSGDPYTVDYYRGSLPAKINTTEFLALEAWCNELVPDGAGGTESRFEFNGIFDSQEECKTQLDKLGAMCRANFWQDGNQYRVWIDKPTNPTFIVCMGNTLYDSYTSSSTDIQKRPKFIESSILSEKLDFATQPIKVVNNGSPSTDTMKLDGFGCTAESQLARYCKFLFDKNDNNDLSYQWEMDVAGMDIEPGQVGYIQNDSNGRAQGGRIVDSGADWVEIDKVPTFTPDFGTDYKLVVQTIDVDGKHIDIYDVTDVDGYTVTLSAALMHTPVKGDVFIFGESENLDLCRVLRSKWREDHSCEFVAEQYKSEYYTRDAGSPDLDTTVYVSAVRTSRKTLKSVTREDLLEGVPEEQILNGDVLNSLGVGNLIFTGDAIDTVTWSTTNASGYAWIRYMGTSYPIYPDATGTTARWIYFDPNAEDPTTLKTTSDIDDLAGLDRFVVCENKSGIAYATGGTRISADSAKLDGIEEGATAGATWGMNINDQPAGYLIQWQEESASHPEDPEEGWAYYNTTDGKSYIYHDSAWYQMTADGVAGANGADGDDGLSIVWKGDSSSPPADPVENWAYRDTDDGIVYLYNGSAWEPMVYDGSDGTDGTSGTDGVDGLSVFITYHDNEADEQPDTPVGDGTTDGWHTDATADVVWMSQRVGSSSETDTLGVDLTAHWKMNDNAATTAVADSTENGNNLIAQANTSTKTTTGKINSGLIFNGSSDYLTVAATNFTGEIGTWTVWIKPAELHVGTIFCSSDEAGATKYICLRLTAAGALRYVATNTASDALETAEGVITADEWNHVALTSDGSTIKCYVNGAEVSLSVSSGSNAGKWLSDIPDRDNFTIGVIKQNALWYYFNGIIDDARVYSRTLALSDVQDIYNSGSGTEAAGMGDDVTWGTPIRISGTAVWDEIIDKPTSIRQMFYQATEPATGMVTGDYWQDSDDKKWYRYDVDSWEPVQDTDIVSALNLATSAQAIADGKIITHVAADPPLIAHWKMNDNAEDTVVEDSSGNEYDLAAHANTDTLTDTGKISSALSFNGSSDYCSRAATGFDQEQGAILAWIKLTSDQIGIILGSGDHGVNNRYFRFRYNNSVKRVEFTLNNGGTTQQIYGSTAIEIDTWYHVAITSDGSEIRMYVNGIAETLTVASGSNAGQWFADVTGRDSVTIGVSIVSSVSGYFAGLIDDVRVYSRALTQGEILRIYNDGSGTEDVKVPDIGDLWLDSGDNNKPYRWSGSAWVAVDYDVASWNKIVGTGKPADNADVTADANIASGLFRDTFEDPNNNVATRWVRVYGDGELSIVSSSGVAGGKVLSVGNNSGTDRAVLTYYKSIPFDPSKLYRLRFRMKRTAGTGACYAGLCGRNITDDANIEYNGPGTYGTHWIAATNSVPTDWTVYTAYFKGTAATGDNTVHSDPSDPAVLNENVHYIRPMFYVNYGASGTFQVDEVSLDIVPDPTDLGVHSILYHGSTAPANPITGYVWWDTSGSPTVVKRYSGTEWVSVGVDLQSWQHGVDKTKLDGSQLYPLTVTTDKLAANSVTASKILVESLSAICAYIGTLVGGDITGVTITGGLLRTATSGRRVQLDETGFTVITSDTAGKYGTFKYGAKKYGSGQLARVGNTASGVPFEVVSEQSVADFRYVNRVSNPSGAAQVGDTAVVGGKLKICTVAGTPGTWTVVGAQTA